MSYILLYLICLTRSDYLLPSIKYPKLTTVPTAHNIALISGHQTQLDSRPRPKGANHYGRTIVASRARTSEGRPRRHPCHSDFGARPSRPADSITITSNIWLKHTRQGARSHAGQPPITNNNTLRIKHVASAQCVRRYVCCAPGPNRRTVYAV